jgi:hypothetical protein
MKNEQNKASKKFMSVIYENNEGFMSFPKVLTVSQLISRVCFIREQKGSRKEEVKVRNPT